jgi:uncharacterized sulfatase
MTRRTLLAAPAILTAQNRRPPNILIAIADDQSWLHTSAYGDPVVRTPAFDRVARNGVLFQNAFCAAPQCAPSRAAFLTGRHIWQLEEAGTHASFFPRKWKVFTERLQQSGYHIGLTGKGAGPCDWQGSGWEHNPAGPAYNSHKAANPPEGVNANDYAANFAGFLSGRPKDKPFCFWFGSQEPHRIYKAGSGIASGKALDKVRVPGFLPDCREVRSDILDYLTEIEYFDRQLDTHLKLLEKQGQLENTLVIVTADNGMSFPHSKANLYDHGWHLPLAISWPARFPKGRTVTDLVSFIDLAPTILEAAGVPLHEGITGRSLLPTLDSSKSGLVDSTRTRVLAGRERHSHARYDNLGYPARAIRTSGYLYIRNFKPDRWPAGDPELYADIDNGPSKTYMMENRAKSGVDRLFALAFGKRPEEELFDLRKDPDCLHNLALSKTHERTRAGLRSELDQTIASQGDPRARGSEIFDSYPRVSDMRPQLGGFAERAKYNPRYK